MTGPGRNESYRDRLISAQAMSAVGGADHRARVGVTDERGWWRGPFVDYQTVFATEDEARSHGIRIGMEIVDAERDSLDCRWHPITGRWGDLPRSRGSS